MGDRLKSEKKKNKRQHFYCLIRGFTWNSETDGVRRTRDDYGGQITFIDKMVGYCVRSNRVSAEKNVAQSSKRRVKKRIGRLQRAPLEWSAKTRQKLWKFSKIM